MCYPPQSQMPLPGEELDDNEREDEEEPVLDEEPVADEEPVVNDQEFMRNERARDELAHSEMARSESELPTASQLAAGASTVIDPVVLIKYQLSLTLKGSHGRGLNAQVLDDAKAWPEVQGVHHADACRKAMIWCAHYPRIASRQWSIRSIRVTADYVG
jgi:hypothetical protein